jgi:hypothetical protein
MARSPSTIFNSVCIFWTTCKTPFLPSQMMELALGLEASNKAFNYLGLKDEQEKNNQGLDLLHKWPPQQKI